MMPINLSDITITILNINGSNYCCIISLISKNIAINPMQNTDLTEESRTLQNKNILSYKNMGKEFLKFGKIEIEKG